MSVAATPRDIGSLFLDMASRRGDHPAVVYDDTVTTFSELARRIEALSRGFTRAGIAPGSRAAVLMPPSPDWIAVVFALMRANVTCVLIDPGIGFANMGRCLAEAAPEAFIGSRKAHLARIIGRWAPTSRIAVCDEYFLGTRRLQDIMNLGSGAASNVEASAPQASAAILFTSGSTGAPKGAVYAHSMFVAQVDALRALFPVAEGDASLATFPLFALFDVALGMTVHLPTMDFTRPGFVKPENIIGPIQKHRIAQLFGSPALLERVGRFGSRHGIALPSLKRVMSAGAPVSARTLAQFSTLLSNDVPIYTPYGATEALPVAITDSREILAETAEKTARGAGINVGRPVPGTEVSIIRISDEPISRWSPELLVDDGEVGEIVVSGPVVTREYFRRPVETRLAKIPEGTGMRHRMGDLGYFDKIGRLWYCGRKSQRVRTPSKEWPADQIEGIFNAHPAVRRTAFVQAGTKAALCVEVLPHAEVSQDQLKRELFDRAASAGFAGVIDVLLFHPSFPVDIRHNAKIGREALSSWAREQLA